MLDCRPCYPPWAGRNRGAEASMLPPSLEIFRQVFLPPTGRESRSHPGSCRVPDGRTAGLVQLGLGLQICSGTPWGGTKFS